MPLTLANGSDSGAGLAGTGMLLQRASATLSNGTCGTFGGFATIASDPLLSTSDLTVTTGHCYVYRYVVSDQVGNQAVYTSSNVVKVDSQAPVAVQDDPGQYVTGTVTLTSNSSDTGGSGLASVAFQRSPTGAGSWTTMSTDTASPWQTSLDTTTLAEGGYDFRVIATDGAGNATTSAVVANVRVDNANPTVTLADPGRNVHGTVALSATASDAGSGVASITYQTSPAGQNTWTTTAASWNTTALADGLYDVHAIAADNAGNTRSSTVVNVRVDNTLPTATLDDPGQYVHGIVSLNSTTADSGSGIDHVAYQYSVAGAETWSTTDAAWDTTSLSDGQYDLRVSATDRAGNVADLDRSHGHRRQQPADRGDDRPGRVL